MDLEIEGVSKEELQKHLDQVPLRYFSHSGREEVALHTRMVHEFLTKKPQDIVPLSIGETMLEGRSL